MMWTSPRPVVCVDAVTSHWRDRSEIHVSPNNNGTIEHIINRKYTRYIAVVSNFVRNELSKAILR